MKTYQNPTNKYREEIQKCKKMKNVVDFWLSLGRGQVCLTQIRLLTQMTFTPNLDIAHLMTFDSLTSLAACLHRRAAHFCHDGGD